MKSAVSEVRLLGNEIECLGLCARSLSSIPLEWSLHSARVDHGERVGCSSISRGDVSGVKHVSSWCANSGHAVVGDAVDEAKGNSSGMVAGVDTSGAPMNGRTLNFIQLDNALFRSRSHFQHELTDTRSCPPPTHRCVPLLARVWGRAWFERGCLSAHYQNMVVEGEEVRASMACPGASDTTTKVWANKADGTPVLVASASIGPNHSPTLLEQRMAKLRPPERLVILADLRVGMTGAEDELVRMDFDQHMGELYPFSLRQKLERITENSPWYSDASASPWGRCVIPLEMVSVLAEHSRCDQTTAHHSSISAHRAPL